MVGTPVGRAAQHRHRAGRDRLLDEVVAVDALARDGDEEAARLGSAGVDERPTGHGRLRVGCAVSGATDHVGDLGQRHRDHRDARSCTASRATRRSSNGCTSPWISCPVSCPLPAISTTSPGAARRTASKIAVRRSPTSTTSATPSRGAGEDGRADRGRVLGARVVVGHDQHVGEAGGDLAHDRPLAGIAVPAGAEHHDDLAVGERAQGRQDGLDGVGLVGVVDDQHEVLAGVDLFEPARNAGPRPIPVATSATSSPASAAEAMAASALETLKAPGTGTRAG